MLSKFFFLAAAFTVALLFTTLALVNASIRNNNNNNNNVIASVEDFDILENFCNKNKDLCDELDTKGINRNDQMFDLGRGFYRATIEGIFETLFEYVKEQFSSSSSSSSIFNSINSLSSKTYSQLSSLKIAQKYQQRHTSSSTSEKNWVDSVASEDIDELRKFLAENEKMMNLKGNPADDKYKYWGFIPAFKGRAMINTPTDFAPTRCSDYTSVTASMSSPNSDSISVHVKTQMRSPKPVLCEDYWMFTVGPASVQATIKESGEKTFVLNVTANQKVPGYVFDMKTNGVRVFLHDRNALLRSLALVDTLLLFKPMINNVLDETSAKNNMFYFNEYSKITPPVTARPNYTGILWDAVNMVRSGDLIAKAELDGLGPTEGLTEGTFAGHTSTALKDPKTGEIVICESVIPGVICTPIKPWIENLQKIGMMTVWLPLSEKYRARFNETAAWEKVQSLLFNAYGYPNVLLGLVDFKKGNLPSFPPFPSGDRYLSMESLEFFVFYLNELIPSTADYLLGQALNHRVGVWNQPIPEVLMTGYKKLNGMRFGDIMEIVEDDSWLYNTTNSRHKGKRAMLPSYVCSTLACIIQKAAGVYDDIDREIQCTELTPENLYAMNMYAMIGENRPEVCKKADPLNPLCQLCGNYTFYLQEHNLNTRKVVKYMGNHCMSANPSPYIRTGCDGGTP